MFRAKMPGTQSLFGRTGTGVWMFRARHAKHAKFFGRRNRVTGGSRKDAKRAKMNGGAEDW